MMTLKQLEYWTEGEKRIKLEEIESQILQLNNEDSDDMLVDLELSTEEKVYRNDVVSKRKNLHTVKYLVFY